MRAIHGHELLYCRLECAAGANAHHDGVGALEPAFDLGSGGFGQPDGGGVAIGVGGDHFDQIQGKTRFETAGQIHATTNGVIKPHLDQSFADRERNQTLCGLTGDAQLGGDLFLRVAGDIV